MHGDDDGRLSGRRDRVGAPDGPKRPPAVVLIDGEHYPPVVVEAIGVLSARFDVRAAVFLGGREKLSEPVRASANPVTAPDSVAGTGVAEDSPYGVPLVTGPDAVSALEGALALYRPEVVVDASDEPVLGYRERFRLISHALARDVAYEGSDFRFTPPRLERLSSSPSISVIGTGKRVGKTAVSGYLAREVQHRLAPVVVVAMGRGGPAEPEIVDGLDKRLLATDLVALSRQGRHAASDHFEDAALSRVVTVGCRRCGGGMAGEPLVSNVAEGARLANGLAPGLVVFEGSGAALPPVATDARLLVAGANQPGEYITGYLGEYRVLVSDAVVLSMAEPPLATADAVRRLLDEIGGLRPGIPVVPVGFRPHPVEPVEGRRVAVFTTAPRGQEGVLGRYLEERYGCMVETVSCSLADRPALRRDLADRAIDRAEVFLTEIKAAAIDVVAEEAERRGLPVVFMDNLPEELPPAEPGILAETCRWLADLAAERHETG